MAELIVLKFFLVKYFYQFLDKTEKVILSCFSIIFLVMPFFYNCSLTSGLNPLQIRSLYKVVQPKFISRIWGGQGGPMAYHDLQTLRNKLWSLGFTKNPEGEGMRWVATFFLFPPTGIGTTSAIRES